MNNAAKSEDRLSKAELRKLTSVAGQEFFCQSTVDLARGLLGCVLVHNDTAGVIVETEAYLGGDDLASHSARGITPRTKVIFGPPGRAYVYFIYGMYECLNIVAEPDGVPGCVLIRALEPVTGTAVMRQRRNWTGKVTGLANGPGKLTRALGVGRELYGTPLFEGPLTVRTWHSPPKFEIFASPRIGIQKCAEWPLRFTWRGHACLSRPE